MNDNVRQIIREEVRLLMLEARIEVNAREFVNSHGKDPRGTGNWAFRLEKNERGQDGDIFWPSSGGKGVMPFTKALALAKQEAKETGMNFVFVLP
jgi:hypothetical protein